MLILTCVYYMQVHVTRVERGSTLTFTRNLSYINFLSFTWERKFYRGGGVLNYFLHWEASPRGPTPYPFIYHFSRKRYPFRIPSINKWYPFHIPCLELCIPLHRSLLNARSLAIMGINRKNGTFSRLYKAIKFIC